MDKKSKLQDLKKRMQKDKTLPLRSGATQLVFGEGNPDTKIYFLGEAPGYFEDKHGRPFVGLAGQLLDKLIESIGLKRDDVYISNVVRFRPPANRDPQPSELAAFAPYVDEEINIIDPKVIVTLGRFSMNKFLPDVRISAVHGIKSIIDWPFDKSPFDDTPFDNAQGKQDKQGKNGKRIIVMPMYHPAAALRNGAIMETLKKDFLLIKLAMEDESDKKNDEESIIESQLSLI